MFRYGRRMQDLRDSRAGLSYIAREKRRGVDLYGRRVGITEGQIYLRLFVFRLAQFAAPTPLMNLDLREFIPV